MDGSSREQEQSTHLRIPRSRTIAYDRDITEISPSRLSPTSPSSRRNYEPNWKGKSMFEEGEYVETSSVAAARSNSSKTMSGAVNGVKKQALMHSMTVRLPKNPFIDDDYADMTGHQNNRVKMDMLRRTLKDRPKARSQSESRIKTETALKNSGTDVEEMASPSRDSMDPRSRSTTAGSQTSSIRSDRTCSAITAEDTIDAGTVIEKEESSISPSNLPTNIRNNVDINISTMTTVPEENSYVAIVVEETAAPVNSYQTFSHGVKLSDEQDKTRRLKIPCTRTGPKVIATAAIITAVIFLGIMSVLGYLIVEKDKEITRLQNNIVSLLSSTTIQDNSQLYSAVLNTTHNNNLLSTIPPMTTSMDLPTTSVASATTIPLIAPTSEPVMTKETTERINSTVGAATGTFTTDYGTTLIGSTHNAFDNDSTTAI